MFGEQGNALASVVLEPAGAGTKVTWGLDTDLGFNPIARYFGMMMDGMVGPDYEKGLARLKAVAESAAAPSRRRRIVIASRPPVHPDMAGHRGDAAEPVPDARIGREVEVAVPGHVGVGIEGDVGDGIGVAGEPRGLAEPFLHHAERLVAAGVKVGEPLGAHLRPARPASG